MRLIFISFSRKGWELENNIADRVSQSREHTVVMRKVKCSAMGGVSEEKEISKVIGEWISYADGIVFIGSCGIAVRLIAPYVNSKTSDPAVVVIDESGRFCISLLSGHIGGANELTKYIADIIGAIPVITTATDIGEKFSVDTFAVKNDMVLPDMELAKKISADIVDGKKVGMYSEFEIEGTIPYEIQTDLSENTCDTGFAVTVRKSAHPFKNTLMLCPRVIIVGIGCKRNTANEQIENAVIACLNDMDISIYAVEAVSSIDIKKNEKGLLNFCKKFNLELRTFSAGELSSVEGEFHESDFVMRVTGVGSVCERSAVFCSKGRLIMNKRVFDGVTVALALKDWSCRF